MIRVLISDNAALREELASPAFQRVGVDLQVADSGADTLARVKSRPPEVVVLSAALPDGDGYDLCRQLKDDTAEDPVRVVLFVEGALTAEVVRKLSGSRCDDVLVSPVAGETLFHKVATLLGLSQRLRRRMAVELSVEVSQASQHCSGQVVDLNEDGARLVTDRAVEKGANATLQIRAAPQTEPVTVGARVVWSTDEGGSWLCGVRFLELDAVLRAALTDLSLWEVVDRPDGTQRVILQGDFREHTDFSRLGPRLQGTVDFDLTLVRYLNSAGVRHWVNLLRSLDRVQEYRFVHASVPFVIQASMVPEVLGRGRMDSFLVPYACEECDLEEDRLLQVVGLAGAGWPPVVPDFDCPRCPGELVFDDLPQRYFAFLENDPRLKP